MTLTEAQERLRQTKTPERIEKYARHSEDCLGGAELFHRANGTPVGMCRCGGAKVYGYGYAVILEGRRF